MHFIFTGDHYQLIPFDITNYEIFVWIQPHEEKTIYSFFLFNGKTGLCPEIK